MVVFMVVKLVVVLVVGSSYREGSGDVSDKFDGTDDDTGDNYRDDDYACDDYPGDDGPDDDDPGENCVNDDDVDVDYTHVKDDWMMMLLLNF